MKDEGSTMIMIPGKSATLLPLFGTLDVDHLFHSSGWENDAPHKILNGQWNNGNVLMIKL
jgi:hypothetical protein